MPYHFHSIDCPSCQHPCDGMDSHCPECGAELQNPGSAAFDRAVRVSYGRQFLLLGVGYMGLTVLATLLAFFVNRYYMGYTVSFHRNQLVNTVTYLIAYPILLVTLLLIAGPRLKTGLSSFRKISPYLAGFLGFIAIFLFDIIYGQFEVNLLHALGRVAQTNANQSNVNAIIKSFPIEALLVLGIVGPICEELTYRVGLFGLCSRINRVAAYAVSALFFGLIHFSFTGDLVVELLALPTYLFGGLAFSFLYDRFGLAASVTAHAMNNCFSVLVNLMI